MATFRAKNVDLCWRACVCVCVSGVLVLVWLRQSHVDHLTLVVPVRTQPYVVVLGVAANRYRYVTL